MSAIPPFLEGLPAPLHAEIQAISKTYTLKSRQALFQEGDSADRLFILKKGCLMLSKVNSKGAELCLNLIFEPHL